MSKVQKFRVKVGLGTLDKLMTVAQAEAYGNKNIPADLKRAGFTTSIFQSDPEIHGSAFLRVNYGKVVPSSKTPSPRRLCA
jgi:hypothetical protein